MHRNCQNSIATKQHSRAQQKNWKPEWKTSHCAHNDSSNCIHATSNTLKIHNNSYAVDKVFSEEQVEILSHLRFFAAQLDIVSHSAGDPFFSHFFLYAAIFALVLNIQNIFVWRSGEGIWRSVEVDVTLSMPFSQWVIVNIVKNSLIFQQGPFYCTKLHSKCERPKKTEEALRTWGHELSSNKECEKKVFSHIHLLICFK